MTYISQRLSVMSVGQDIYDCKNMVILSPGIIQFSADFADNPFIEGSLD